MQEYERLASELTLLLRAMKDLQVHAIERTRQPFELAGSAVLGRLEVLGRVRLTELAQALGLDPSSVSRHVTALERAGLLAREKDPTDQRAQHLVLTDAGRAAVSALRVARAEALATLTPGWTPAEIDDLTDRLVRLHTDITTHRARLDACQETA